MMRSAHRRHCDRDARPQRWTASLEASARGIQPRRSARKVGRRGWCDARCRGHKLVQQFEPLRCEFNRQRCHARQIAARSGEARDKSDSDRVEPARENDRYAERTPIRSSKRGQPMNKTTKTS